WWIENHPERAFLTVEASLLAAWLVLPVFLLVLLHARRARSVHEVLRKRANHRGRAEARSPDLLISFRKDHGAGGARQLAKRQHARAIRSRKQWNRPAHASSIPRHGAVGARHQAFRSFQSRRRCRVVS